MKWLIRLSSGSSIIGELFRFLWRERLWWMIPIMLALVACALLVLFAQASPLSPFIYTLF